MTVLPRKTLSGRTAAALLATALAASSVAGCAYIEEQTGFSKNTQRGAAAGATFGGVIAALSNANPAWVAASVIMGGVTGGVIGDYLDKRSAEKAASNQYNSLQTLGQGQSSSWTNSSTGHSGSTTVTRVYTTAGGATCKDFVEVIETPQKTFRENGTACQQANGSYRVI